MNNRERIPAISSFLASRWISRLPCWLVDSQRFLMSPIFEKLIGRSRVVRFAFTISVSTSEKYYKKILIQIQHKKICTKKMFNNKKSFKFSFGLRKKFTFVLNLINLWCKILIVCLFLIAISSHLFLTFGLLRFHVVFTFARFFVGYAIERFVRHANIHAFRLESAWEDMQGGYRYSDYACNMFCCSCVFSSYKLRKENCWLLNTAKMSLVPVVSHTK